MMDALLLDQYRPLVLIYTLTHSINLSDMKLQDANNVMRVSGCSVKENYKMQYTVEKTSLNHI